MDVCREPDPVDDGYYCMRTPNHDGEHIMGIVVTIGMGKRAPAVKFDDGGPTGTTGASAGVAGDDRQS